jgi:hypothetical protein
MAVQTNFTMGMRIAKSMALTSIGGGTAATGIEQGMTTAFSWNAATTPAIDESYSGRFTLSGGALTVALDALAQQNQPALDLSTKVIYAFCIHNLAASAAMTFVGAAANPYELFGGATSEITLDPDGWCMFSSPTGFGTVGASNSDIDVSGTGTDSFDLMLVAG